MLDKRLHFAASLLFVAVASWASDFPSPYDTEPDKTGPMPAMEAAAKMTLPPGFKATVFAAEPEVRNPIAMTWDGRGRLWVAENYTDAEAAKRFDLQLRRILIFEDKNHDDRIPRTDLSAFDARQILSFHDAELNAQLAEVWGEFRESAADKRDLIARFRQQLTPGALSKADKAAGRVIYTALCASCHKLYGEGIAIGPDLTGSGRSTLDYLLENIIDPGAVVDADFRTTVLTLKDGRVLHGFISTRTNRTITLRTMVETLTVERGEIVSIEELPQSLMPEGLLLALSETQIRDLIACLMHPTQVALPASTP